jgi:hypothetical protein
VGHQAAAILLAVPDDMRLLVLVAIFRFASASSSARPGGALRAAATRRLRRCDASPEVVVSAAGVEPEPRRNPLEINSAVLFAALFGVLATSYS